MERINVALDPAKAEEAVNHEVDLEVDVLSIGESVILVICFDCFVCCTIVIEEKELVCDQFFMCL